MAKSVKARLEDTFNDLGKDELKKFKNKLCDRKKDQGIRKARIENVTDAIDLADLMVITFTSTGAVPVTVEILELIGCNEQAAELKENTGQGLPVARSGGDVVDSKAGQGLKIYEIKNKPVRKRLALLINNIDFEDKALTRKGADRDEDNMEWLLKELDYQVVKHKNLSAKDMEKAVKDFAQRQEHAYSDSTFVVIMSHGKRDAILGVHYNASSNPSDTFLTDKIYHCLNTENCPGLRDKPKVILIQACRGDTKSYRHVQNGTFYVQNLVDVIMNHAHEDHIEELFRKSTSSTGIGQSRVYNVDAILDQLLVITEEVYSNIRAEKTPQIKMRELLMGPMKSAGTKGKDALYKALKDTESCLIEDLERQ
ncbi:hypothetical protein cypCar_00024794 [Cyprinus carpio]|nr:hypothetical protein cypCar_00024794 [Cyprinus carpio]